LNLKNIKYELIPVNLLEKEHQANTVINPMKQVPTLEFLDENRNTIIRISQSMAIIEFLENSFEDTCRLYPHNENDAHNLLVAKAKCKQFAEMINSGVQPLQNLSMIQMIDQECSRECSSMNGRELAKYFIEFGLSALEAEIISYRNKNDCLTNSTHFSGNSPTFFEVFLIPQLYNARRFSIDLNRLCPTLLQIEQTCIHHPSFVQAHPDKQLDAVLVSK